MIDRQPPDAGSEAVLRAASRFCAARNGVSWALVAACWIGALAPTGLSQVAAVDFYVDGDRPVNGSGTESDPFNTLRSVPPGADRTIFVAGTIRESTAWGGGWRDTVVCQWPGRAATEIRGDVPVPPHQWQKLGAALCMTPLAAAPVSVIWNWDENVDEYGRRFGHLSPQASFQQCSETPGSWFFDAAQSLLYVNAPPGGRSPADGDTYAWVRAGTGLTLSEPVRVQIRDLRFTLWCDPASTGYGLRLSSASGCTVSGCVFQDCGYHAAGFVGTICTGNRFVSCTARGLAGRSNHFVFYSSMGDVAECAAVDCEVHQYTLLGWDGAPLDRSARCGGYYTHTGGSAQVRDLEFRRCRAIGYDDGSGNSFGVGTATAAALDERVVETYPVRFIECEAVNGDYVNIDGHAAFVRCRLDLRRASRTGGAAGACIMFNRPGTVIALESCEVITRLNGASASRAAWPKNPGDRLILLGSTFYDDFDAPASRSFLRAEATATIIAEQTVFSARRELSLTSGSTEHTPDNFDFRNCWYHGITPGRYSSSPALDEQSEWLGLIDELGWYNVSPEFASPPGNLAPKVNGPLWRSRLPLEGVERLGITGKQYDGRSGAHQFAWPIAAATTSCPAAGPINVSWTQASPRGSVVLVYSRTTGSWEIPAHLPCAGLWLDLGAPSLMLVGVFASNDEGSGSVAGTAPRDACGGYLQIIDVQRCATSNTMPLR